MRIIFDIFDVIWQIWLSFMLKNMKIRCFFCCFLIGMIILFELHVKLFIMHDTSLFCICLCAILNKFCTKNYLLLLNLCILCLFLLVWCLMPLYTLVFICFASVGERAINNLANKYKLKRHCRKKRRSTQHNTLNKCTWYVFIYQPARPDCHSVHYYINHYQFRWRTTRVLIQSARDYWIYLCFCLTNRVTL